MGIIYIDADACSVKNETYKVAIRYDWPVRVVANQQIRTPASELIVCITVEDGDDVADDWIAERCVVGDVVVTNDIPLAARCVDRGARVLDQRGQEHTPASIGGALAGRNLSEELRELGVIPPLATRTKATRRFTRVEVMSAPDRTVGVSSPLRVRLGSGAVLEWAEAPRGEALRELVGVLGG